MKPRGENNKKRKRSEPPGALESGGGAGGAGEKAMAPIFGIKRKPRAEPMEVDLGREEERENLDVSAVSNNSVIIVEEEEEEEEVKPRRNGKIVFPRKEKTVKKKEKKGKEKEQEKEKDDRPTRVIYEPELDHTPFPTVGCAATFPGLEEEETWSSGAGGAGGAVLMPRRLSRTERVSERQCPSSWNVPVTTMTEEEWDAREKELNGAAEEEEQEKEEEDRLEEPSVLREEKSVKKTVKSLTPSETRWYQRAAGLSLDARPWTDALAPKSGDEWIGDENVVEEVRQFISKWKKRVRREQKKEAAAGKKASKGRRRADDSDSDYEGEGEGGEALPNPLILEGPSGSGKSALVHALCSELGASVLEMHAGEKRNGAEVRRKLQGASQTHRVSSAESLRSFFGGKKEKEEAAACSPLTVILVENVDVWCADDKEFHAAIKGVALAARVPVVWTCEREPRAELMREPVMQREMKLTLTRPPPARVVDYVRGCLAGLLGCVPSLACVERAVSRAGGDVRAVLNDVQWAGGRVGRAEGGGEITLSCHRPAHPLLPATAPREWEERPSVWTGREKRRERERREDRHMRSMWQRGAVEKLSLFPRPAPSWAQQQQQGWQVEMGRHRLADVAACVKNFHLVRSSLARDYVPALVAIDGAERQRREREQEQNGAGGGVGRRGRTRFMHYFSEVRQWHENRSIDQTGGLVQAIQPFRMTTLLGQITAISVSLDP